MNDWRTTEYSPINSFLLLFFCNTDIKWSLATSFFLLFPVFSWGYHRSLLSFFQFILILVGLNLVQISVALHLLSYITFMDLHRCFQSSFLLISSLFLHEVLMIIILCLSSFFFLWFHRLHCPFLNFDFTHVERNYLLWAHVKLPWILFHLNYFAHSLPSTILLFKVSSSFFIVSL